MKASRVERKAFERVYDESEMAVARCLEQLFRTGWTSTVVTRRIYYERVSWYGHTPYDCRMVIADLVSGDRVLIWITDDEKGPWGAPRATIYRGRHEVWELFHHSDVPPIWATDRRNDAGAIEDILEGKVGKRRLNNFLKRLKYSPKVFKTRFIKKKTFFFAGPGGGYHDEWTGSVLRVYVPDTTLESFLPASKRYFHKNIPDDPLVLALLDIPVGVQGVEIRQHSVDIAWDERESLKEVTRAVFEVLNRFRV